MIGCYILHKAFVDPNDKGNTSLGEFLLPQGDHGPWVTGTNKICAKFFSIFEAALKLFPFLLITQTEVLQREKQVDG